MTDDTQTRKLATIVALDVAGYSARAEADEEATTAEVSALRKVIEGIAVRHGGRVFNTAGDGFMLEFGSSLAAVEAAFVLAETCEPKVRVGVHLGDVVVQPNGDLLGHGVNVAARLMAQSPPGAALISGAVRGSIRGPIAERLRSRGHLKLDKMVETIEAFAIGDAGIAPAKAEAARKVSICVLAFSNISDDPQQEYFSDGISEDIITDLSKVSALGVTARNTSFQFKGKSVDVPTIARQLKVTHVLEGSVRKAAGRVRITAQLIDGASGEHVWAERYDRDLNDIFALQDEISEAIVKALKLRLLPEEKKAIEQRDVTNPEAYELFLLARQFQRTGSERMKPVIVRICQRVAALDPSFARNWALMAMAEAEASQRGAAGASFESAKAAAERAVALDPKLAEAHAALGEALLRGPTMDLAASQPSIEMALMLDPNCYEAHLQAGYLHLALHRFHDSIRHFEVAVALDPESIRPVGMVVQAYDGIGDEQKVLAAARRCLELCEKILRSEPDHGGALGFFVSSLADLGEAERAREWAKRAILFDPDNLRLHYNVACALSKLRDADTAIALLKDIVPKVNSGWLRWMQVDNSLDPIREDPRFNTLIATAEARLTAEGQTAPAS